MHNLDGAECEVATCKATAMYVGVRGVNKCGQYGQQILWRNPSKKIMSVSGAEIGRYSGKKVAHYGTALFSELSLLFSPRPPPAPASLPSFFSTYLPLSGRARSPPIFEAALREDFVLFLPLRLRFVFASRAGCHWITAASLGGVVASLPTSTLD